MMMMIIHPNLFLHIHDIIDRSGASVFMVANCTVNNPALYSLDPSVFSGRGSPIRNQTGGGGALTASPYNNKQTSVDLVVQEMMQTIGGALLDALCMYLAARIVMGVRGLWGKATARPPSVKFDDVIGCNYAKEEVMQLVDYLQDPSKYKKLGAKIPKGVLLVGKLNDGQSILFSSSSSESLVGVSEKLILLSRLIDYLFLYRSTRCWKDHDGKGIGRRGQCPLLLYCCTRIRPALLGHG